MKDSMKKTVMIAPLLLAFVWMSGLIFNTGMPVEGEMMAPSGMDTLITIIFSFIVLYAVALVVVFYKMNKGLVKKTRAKKKKK